MFALSKISKGNIFRNATVSLCRPSVCYSLTSGSCGGSKKGGDKTGGDDIEPCDPCPECRRPSDCNPSTPTMYDCRKYGHCLPCNNVMPCFEHLPNIPTGIFRCTAGEVLGQGAAKGSFYQNPEYFSFQHMTFYDMHLILRCFRIPSPKTGRKP